MKRTIRLTESDIRETIKSTVYEAFSDKYEHCIDRIDYYANLLSELDDKALSDEQVNDIEGIIEYLKETDTGENPETEKWIGLAQGMVDYSNAFSTIRYYFDRWWKHYEEKKYFNVLPNEEKEELEEAVSLLSELDKDEFPDIDILITNAKEMIEYTGDEEDEQEDIVSWNLYESIKQAVRTVLSEAGKTRYNEMSYHRKVNGEDVIINCYTLKTRSGWLQNAEMEYNGDIVTGAAKYTNRQWEPFEYAKAIKNMFYSIPEGDREAFLESFFGEEE